MQSKRRRLRKFIELLGVLVFFRPVLLFPELLEYVLVACGVIAPVLIASVVGVVLRVRLATVERAAAGGRRLPP